ncbi:MAG: hypothetical protein FD177_2399 [Desulfovibrionaceae bacterium]|nr:MAG: hypothetical protein FD177_2399 [Desulfovibrionaceae bacterium]
MDAADEAQKHEAAFLDAAVRARRIAPTEEQLRDESGAVICVDCDELIPAARLKSVPDAVRCVECQAAWEASL